VDCESSVDIAMDYMSDRHGSILRRDSRSSLFPCVQIDSKSHHASYTRIRRIKWSITEAERSPPFSGRSRMMELHVHTPRCSHGTAFK
jgi:hypothetical protein